MNRKLRILKCWYYGRIGLAKKMKQYRWKQCFMKAIAKVDEVKKPTYTFWDSKTGKTFEAEDPVSATIKLRKENYNHEQQRPTEQ